MKLMWVAAAVLAASLQGCSDSADSDDAGHFAGECADELTFQGTVYRSTTPGGDPLPGLPEHVERGAKIGTGDPECSGAPESVAVHRIKGLSPDEAIWVGMYGGPMAPEKDLERSDP